MVLPRAMRDEIVSRLPGEVILRRTADGLLMTPADSPGNVGQADDGLPVLAVGRRVTNDEVLASIDAERASR